MASMPRIAVRERTIDDEVDPIWIAIYRLSDVALQEIREMLARPAAFPQFPGTLVVAGKFAGAEQLRRQLVLNPEFARLLLCRSREHTDRHAEPVVAIRRRLSDLSA